MDTPLRSVKLAQVTEWDDGQARSGSDNLAAEEPLQILACGNPLGFQPGQSGCPGGKR
jgi:hypothetical protein